MVHLAVVGPYVTFARYSDYPGQTHEIPGEITFRRSNVSPFVGRVYGVAIDFARRSGVEVSLPEAFPDSEPRTLWIDAVDRLARADAVFAVFDGESQAIPLEAALARQMDLPLLVAASGTNSTEPFERSGFRVIDVQLGRVAVEQALQQFLFGESATGVGQGPGVPVPLQ